MESARRTSSPGPGSGTLRHRHAGSSWIEDSSSEPLRRAAARVADAWRERLQPWEPPGPDEADEAEEEAHDAHVLEPLRVVVEGVEEIRAGGRPVVAEAARMGSFAHVRLAEALRSELFREWRGGGAGAEGDGEEGRGPAGADPEEILELLAAVEDLVRMMWPGREADPAARLGDPDALELVSEMAHDLLSPLNSILFLSETLRSGHSGPVNEMQAGQLGLMYSAALHIMVMAGDVMEIAKGEKTPGAEPPEPFSVREVFERVRDMVRPMAEEKAVGLEFRPPSADAFIGNPVALGRVLLNLTTNGLKFTETGSVTVSARTLGPQEVEFAVQDTGRGIPPDKQRALFEPFQKASGREGHFFSVSGLGLSICRRLVASMGSELHFETEEGKGTRFHFRLRLPTKGR